MGAAFAFVVGVALAAAGDGAVVEEIRTEVCVVGGGSGGFGAAWGAAGAGAKVVLVEQMDRLGGTSTCGYVSNWEPGPDGVLSREIHRRLAEREGVGITRDHNADRKLGPFGLWLIDSESGYEQTLQRAGWGRDRWRAAVFDPNTMAELMGQMLEETGRCRVLSEHRCFQAEMDGKRVSAVLVRKPDGTVLRISARVFIDSTGGAQLCRLAGCETMLGAEARSRFGEPSAPEEANRTLNAITLCYRIRPSDDPTPAAVPDRPLKRCSAHVSGVPGGDLIVNALAMVPGTALLDQGYEKTMEQCREAVGRHWHRLQQYPTFSGYEFDSYAPLLGIRESYRVVTDYVLTEHDLRATLTGQEHRDMIAVADHAMDVHGEGGRSVHGELKGPYGIPYRCLIPKDTENLLVACRGAGFSHVAASSCRLNRTMLAIGHAAGTGAAQAVQKDISVRQVDVGKIQGELKLRFATR